MTNLFLMAGITLLMSNSLTQTPIINYTSDSVIKEGVTLEKYETEVGDVEYNLIVDLPVGYEIYDDPDTVYVDGLKINERWLESYKGIFFREGEDTITVKIVYADDVTGSLAQIHDGTFDWWSLLATPIGIISSAFGGVSVTTLVGLGINAIRSKKTKVKNAEEISTEVKKVAREESKAQAEDTKKLFREYTETVLAPALSEITVGIRDIIKAVAISNSKQKDSPLAILDLLEKDTSDAKIKEIIAEAREKFKESLDKENEIKKSIAKKLESIGNHISEAIAPVEPDTKPDSAEGRY